MDLSKRHIQSWMNAVEAILTSVIHLANSIQCELLAEGLERPEKLAFLKAHNCNVYQGYFYDKPMKVSEFEEKYLRKRHQFQLD